MGHRGTMAERRSLPFREARQTTLDFLTRYDQTSFAAHEIAELTAVQKWVITNALTALIRERIVIRIAPGRYMLNPQGELEL